MLVDTHCHLNMMVKSDFDTPLTTKQISAATTIVQESVAVGVTKIINVGTSFIESKNCVTLAQQINAVYATIGIHPNDCTEHWKQELKDLEQLLKEKEHNKIVGVGECGIDRHYTGYNLQRQYDAFKAHIELALSYDVGLVIHSREAYDETLRILDEYIKNAPRGVLHCFSYDQTFADQVIAWGFKIGVGGTVTYPKNNELRGVVRAINLPDFVLETDAPFLPPQAIRGKQNNPKEIKAIAEYIAEWRGESFTTIAEQTMINAKYVFRF